MSIRDMMLKKSEPREQDEPAERSGGWYIEKSNTFCRDRPVNAMSVDVEEHFQVSAFEGLVSRADWNRLPSRIAKNIDRILALFDDTGAKATFFTLGCVAENNPAIVRDIAEQGHEVASHGYNHMRVRTQTPHEFLDDVSRTKKLLEDIAGVPVTGYRAPSFSIGDDTPWAHDALQRAGYRYSSSIYPINHDHYGLPSAPRFPFRLSVNGFLEIPLSTVSVAGRNLPCAGGGYFRLLPLYYSRWALRRLNNVDSMPAAFYFHPWEIDPTQPRISGLPFKSKFRHYVNLDRFEHRLNRILRDFRWGRMDDIFCPAESGD